MIQLVVSSPDLSNNPGIKIVWNKIKNTFDSTSGSAYYRYPIVKDAGNAPPDLLIITTQYEPIIVKVFQHTIDELSQVNEDAWYINEGKIDSPLLQLQDFLISFKYKFDTRRELRNKLNPICVLAMPFISKADFHKKFGNPTNLESGKIIWKDLDLECITIHSDFVSDPQIHKLLKIICQGATPLIKPGIETATKADKLGEALHILQRQITALDYEQEKVAIQIAPGPQQIKGLAGTGKTVLLAMRAAHLHLRYPERKILFTFNTQSLYNQTRSLISDFYRVHSDSDPNYKQLHVLHAWGSSSRPGVYSEICRRQGMAPLEFLEAKKVIPKFPFKACCKEILKGTVEPYYDYIIVDEAQDFPPEFFHILYALAKEPKAIYYAFDELQSLSALEVPNSIELFGRDENGKAKVDLEGEYPDGIEKEIILQKSYRCAGPVLMTAHAIGLGLNSPNGCVQILRNEDSWNSVGYQIESGELAPGKEVSIIRPEENSPNNINLIYTGMRKLIQVNKFTTKDQELESVANFIKNDIEVENVPPEQIIVVSLNAQTSYKHLSDIQQKLWNWGISSIIPGLHDLSSEFAKKGNVTLTHVFRAKGNEAGIIYVISAEQIASYVSEIEARNRAFTAISRAKGWVTILGSGHKMDVVQEEFATILSNIPRLKFIFPALSDIRRSLDATETTRRRRETKRVQSDIDRILNVEMGALNEQDPTKLKEVVDRLKEVLGEQAD